MPSEQPSSLQTLSTCPPKEIQHTFLKRQHIEAATKWYLYYVLYWGQRQRDTRRRHQTVPTCTRTDQPHPSHRTSSCRHMRVNGKKIINSFPGNKTDIGTDLLFLSFQSDTSLHCQTTDAGLVHRAGVPANVAGTHCIHPCWDGQPELTWVAGYIWRWLRHLLTVTHPSTNFINFVGVTNDV